MLRKIGINYSKGPAGTCKGFIFIRIPYWVVHPFKDDPAMYEGKGEVKDKKGLLRYIHGEIMRSRSGSESESM